MSHLELAPDELRRSALTGFTFGVLATYLQDYVHLDTELQKLD